MVVAAPEVQRRLSLVLRNGVLFVFGCLVLAAAWHLLQPAVACGKPPTMSDGVLSPNLMAIKGGMRVSEGTQGSFACHRGFKIDGHQPLSSVSVTCTGSIDGRSTGTWAGVDGEHLWELEGTKCVPVSYCNPLSENIDTGCARPHRVSAAVYVCKYVTLQPTHVFVRQTWGAGDGGGRMQASCTRREREFVLSPLHSSIICPVPCKDSRRSISVLDHSPFCSAWPSAAKDGLARASLHATGTERGMEKLRRADT